MAEADFEDEINQTAVTDENLDTGQTDTGTEDGGAGGHLSYQEWVDAGNDPDLYQGKKAFEMNQAEIKEKRKLRKDIQSMQTTLQQTVQGFEDFKASERVKIKADLERQLKEAKEAEDVDAALEIQQGLDEIDRIESQPATPQQQKEPDVLLDWRAKRPLVDGDSEQFNPEFNKTMVGYYNAEYNILSQGGRVAVSEDQMERLADKAYNQAKTMYPELFESQRNQRQTTGQRRTQQRQTQTQDDTDVNETAENYHIPVQQNSVNRGDLAASQVKQAVMRVAKENAERAGKSAAEIQADVETAGKQFEKNLYR